MPPKKEKEKDMAIQIAKLELLALVGDVKTPEQIMRASHWLDKIRCDSTSKLNDQAWMSHFNHGHPGFNRIIDEMSFYRIIGEPSAFDFPSSGTLDDRTFEELCLLGERWALLALENILGELEEHPDIHKVKFSGGTVAQRLKAYLEVHKQVVGFDKWSEEHMNNARYRVVQVYDTFLKQRGRPLFKSGMPHI